MVIRRATKADGPAVQRIVFDALRSYGIEPDPDGLDADVIRFGSAALDEADELVAEVDGRVVGSFVLVPRSSGPLLVGWLSKLFVASDMRGRGIGKALLARSVEEARRRGCVRMELRTRTIFREAVALYESTGWARGLDPDAKLGPDRTYWLALDA